MNAITNFRKCTLTNEELMQMVDQQTDAIFTLSKIPTRHIPARPNEDYDLIVGELILRFKELTEQSQLHAIMQAEGSGVSDGAAVGNGAAGKGVSADFWCQSEMHNKPKCDEVCTWCHGYGG